MSRPRCSSPPRYRTRAVCRIDRLQGVGLRWLFGLDLAEGVSRFGACEFDESVELGELRIRVRLLRIIVDIWPICGVYGRSMIRAVFEKQGEIL